MARPHAPSLRVAVVEDETLFRELVCGAIAGMPGFEVVGAFADEAGALAGVPPLAPDVVVLDIDLGGDQNGVRLGARLRTAHPKLATVLLSNHGDAAYLKALAAEGGGGYGYLQKKSLTNLQAIGTAIRGAAQGLVVLDPQVADGLNPSPKVEADGERAAALLGLLAEGLSNMAIADRLCLSERSVENQLRQLYRKLEIDTSDPRVHPRVAAVIKHLQG